MIVEGGILLNACISAVASVLAVYVMVKKIIPTVDGFKESQKKLDLAIEASDATIDEFRQLQEGLMTVEGPEGPMVLPMSDQIMIAGEKMLMSLGGAYLSEKPSKQEQAAHQMQLNGLSTFGYQVGRGVRRGIELDKYDPLIEQYASRFISAGGATEGGPGGDPIAAIAEGMGLPSGATSFIGGLFGGGGGTNSGSTGGGRGGLYGQA